jgi:hypothetical protein
MVEGAGRIAECQAQAEDEQAQPLGGVVAAAPTPEEERTGQGQQQPGTVTPGVDGLTKGEEVQVASWRWSRMSIQESGAGMKYRAPLIHRVLPSLHSRNSGAIEAT